MNPIELYKKADGWLLQSLNNLYLWAMDWTGLYVGTLCFLMGAESCAYMIHRGNHWWAAFNLIFVIAIAGPRYYWQATGNNKLFNAISSYMEEGVFRHIFIWLSLSFIPMHVSMGNWWGALDDVVLALCWYVWCFKIRDREKKEFKLFTPATEGAP